MSYFPEPLYQKFLWSVYSGCGILAISVFLFITLRDLTLLLLSAALFVFLMLRAGCLFLRLLTQNYTILEGCCQAVERVLIGHIKTVTFEDASGTEFQISVDHRQKFILGESYRFYLKTSQTPPSLKLLQGAFYSANLLATEHITSE